MRHDGGWQRRASRYLFESPWFNVRQDRVLLPAGNEITYTVVEHHGYVMVVPLLDDGRVVMERIFRYTLQRTLLECPSGGLDGEDPETAGRRELEEETGYRARRWLHLGRFCGSSGVSTEEFDLFLATDLSHAGVIRREPTEQLEVERIPLEELHAQALRGELADAPTALAILLAWERLHGGG